MNHYVFTEDVFSAALPTDLPEPTHNEVNDDECRRTPEQGDQSFSENIPDIDITLQPGTSKSQQLNNSNTEVGLSPNTPSTAPKELTNSTPNDGSIPLASRHILPENIRPYPKASSRPKTCGKLTKRGKAAILTSTPYKCIANQT
ncbi:UNVERIFIED_CONTAM: hypothetical protein FKN15_043410 [Acipenser sinensis]